MAGNKINLRCNTPYCKNIVYSNSRPKVGEYTFCSECRKEHSYSVLVLQVTLQKPIRDILVEAAQLFKSASNCSQFLGASFVSYYSWVKKYFDMTFAEFKRTYVCKNRRCRLVDIKSSCYSRNDYVLKKVRSRHYCACINALEKDHIMTTAPEALVQEILRGAVKVVKVSDSIFSTKPKSYRYRRLFPVYFR